MWFGVRKFYWFMLVANVPAILIVMQPGPQLIFFYLILFNLVLILVNHGLECRKQKEEDGPPTVGT